MANVEARPKIDFSNARQRLREDNNRSKNVRGLDSDQSQGSNSARKAGPGENLGYVDKTEETIRLREELKAIGSGASSNLDKAKQALEIAKDPKKALTGAAKKKSEMVAKQVVWRSIDAATGGLSAIPGVHQAVEFIAGKIVSSKYSKWIIGLIFLLCFCFCCMIFLIFALVANEVNYLRENKEEVLDIAKDAVNNGDCRNAAGNQALDSTVGAIGLIEIDNSDAVESCITFLACQRLEKRFQDKLQEDFNCKAGGFLPQLSE